MVERTLMRDGDPQPLGSRAFDILLALVERAGTLVSKQELMRIAWPATTVIESNLTVHVAALRRILSDGQEGTRYITNLPGRGYLFVAPIHFAEDMYIGPVGETGALQPQDLPAALVRLIGRDEAVSSVIERTLKHRFVTLVGPGGIGKTSVALVAAKRLGAEFKGGCRFVDLSPLQDPGLIASTIAQVLGVKVGDGDPVAAIVERLRLQPVLLFIDNCEHLIAAAAAVVATLLQDVPTLHVLATSREPLGIAGERVVRLEPLAAPSGDGPLSRDVALSYPALELFLAVARANNDRFEFSDAQIPLLASICRRLDGLPLAIELAAARVDLLGLTALLGRLDRGLALLTQGRRNARPRQKTMLATLEWSYDLLTREEQLALRRLSILRGWFPLQMAIALAGAPGADELDAADLVASLASKSLLTVEHRGPLPTYRLAEITREFGMAKTEEAGELPELCRSSARYLVELLTGPDRAELRSGGVSRHLIDDVRRSLEWALSPDGDVRMSCELIIASAPTWIDLLLISEFHSWTQRVAAPAALITPPDASLQMRLANILALADLENGVTPVFWTALLQALTLAQDIGDANQELLALFGLFQSRGADLECEVAASYAAQVGPAARRAGHPMAQLQHQSHLTHSLFFLGRSLEAKVVADDMLCGGAAIVGLPPALPFEIDPRISALTNRARSNWVCGFPDQARADLEMALAEAMSLDHLVSLYHVLTSGALVPLWLRDLALADRMLDIVKTQAASLRVEHWKAWESAFEFALLPLRQENEAELPSQLARREMEFRPYARAMGCTAHPAHFGSWIDHRAERDDAIWCREEVYRLRGLRHLNSTGGAGIAEAERLVRLALDMANGLGSRGWALRAAMSLCVVLDADGRSSEARDSLADIYAGFTEGFDTFDLRQAKLILNVETA
ncbi:ATP-binding protein [Sphingomonas glacialis]|uniref:ATP-binding protein n=1 Tax=Sphingomonas glacialis TaxID=658225 RepID=UPI001125CDD8|nr:winged helix-turn-helix domain-containing protein [Sphingomonas glacialis]